FNEERTLGFVIKEIPRSIPGVDQIQILVINDGSTDRTMDIAVQAGADKIISHKYNMGLAQSFRDGLNRALEMGADIIVNTDADFQYNGSEIPKLIAPIIEGKADIVLGNRQIDRLDHMPFGNLWGNKLATRVTRWTTGLAIQDAQTGFRAFSRDAALQMNLTGDYTYTQETLIQAANKNLKIDQIPVEFRKREGKSRLISSISRYARSAGITIFRSFGAYHPFVIFSGIGIFCILLGTFFGLKVILHFFMTGRVEPYLPSALLTTVLLIIGFLAILFGLLADMIRTQRMLTEEILFRLKK
ncbi:MAG: glycosyltransferase family 2 protein, partial [Candidatus Methanofastidiosa archaeon]|nr:glycosyltransferase family 2 protein [Candidatus Methanofastidiosa archaeon]